jgi:hypothetical protein
MNTYCLTIKVRSRNEALLNNLLVTVETLNNTINEIDMLEMFTATEGNGSTEFTHLRQFELINKELFLDCWMINEE